MKIEKYLKAIKARLNLPPELRDRVISDLETSIAARREAGKGRKKSWYLWERLRLRQSS